MISTLRKTIIAALALPALVACGAAATASTAPATTPAATISAVPSPQPQNTTPVIATPTALVQRFPEILAAKLSRNADGTFDIAVTVASPYDTPQRYADGWRVLAPDSRVLGEHTLTHDHASEQPFTRTQSGVRIPDDVAHVRIEGHDTANGYGGMLLQVAVPSR